MIQCPCTMRSSLHIVAICLIAIAVAESKPSTEEKPLPQVNPVLATNVVKKVEEKKENNKDAPVIEKKEDPKPTENKKEVEKVEDKPKSEVKPAEDVKPADAKSPEEAKPEKEEITEKVSYKGMKVFRVVLRNKEQKKWIRELENSGAINTWSGNGSAVDILIKKGEVIEQLNTKQLPYDVVIEDLQKAIDEENPQLSEEEWSELEGRKVEPYSQWVKYSYGNGFSSPYQLWRRNDVSALHDNRPQFFGYRKSNKKKRKKGHRLTWQLYHRMTDIHGYLDYLAATYPQMVSLETIGYSVENRPLNVLKISSGEANSPAIWVDSGIHAREWITPAASTYVISQLVESGDGPQGVDWYFLPIVNPDGYEHTHKSDRLWRKNRANSQKGSCAGTDLNRNFGYRWGGQGASKQPCRETYAGTGPFSEPETKAIKEFVTSREKPIKASVSLHSYGQYILYPWGYDRKVPPDYADLDRVGRLMATAMKKTGGQTYTVGSAASTLYPASGGSDDWAKGAAKIKYAYTIELRDTGRHGFVLPAQYIVPTAKEAYAALTTLAQEVKQLKKKRNS